MKFSLVWILLIIIGFAKIHASEDDCTVHYYIAFEYNPLPALVEFNSQFYFYPKLRTIVDSKRNNVQVAPNPLHLQRLCRLCGFFGGEQGRQKFKKYH